MIACTYKTKLEEDYGHEVIKLTVNQLQMFDESVNLDRASYYDTLWKYYRENKLF